MATSSVLAAALARPAALDTGVDVPDGVGDQVASLLEGLSTLAGTAVVLAAAVVAYVLVRWVALRLLASVVHRTDSDWDDRFLHHKAPHRLALVPGALVAALGINAVVGLTDTAVTAVQRVSYTVVVVSITWALFGALDAVNDIYERHEYASSRPIKGYLQLVKLLLSVVAVVLVVAIVAGRSPLLLLSGLGAATAILVLVFRDTILSLVASVQLATNDMVRVGDWITVESLGIDGDVIDIALHTMTIRNFDMTYGFVPTHALITEPFRNWRGMREVEGRRIMRAIHVDVTSVRFLTDRDVREFASWPLLAPHLAQRPDAHDEDLDAAEPTPHAERMTNLGVFRTYALEWLRTRDDLQVDNAFPMMVRLLPPTPSGQPVEVYCFSTEVSWVPFEAVQAEVLDHLHAILPAFGLRAYQYPSGHDLEAARTAVPIPRQEG